MSHNRQNPSTTGAATLDACAVVRTFEVGLPYQSGMCLLKAAWEDGQIRLFVSRRTLYELRKKRDDALTFGEKIEILPSLSNRVLDRPQRRQLGPASRNLGGRKRLMSGLQRVLPVRKGAKIKDRGTIIDSMQAGVQIVVTTDNGMLDRSDAVYRATGVRPLNPDVAAAILLAGPYCPN